MKENKIGLKVTGFLLAIIAGIVILAIIFSKTILPIIMYNNAEKYASQGNYAEAYNILVRCANYKDSPEKRGEYILKVGESYLESGSMDDAINCFKIAYSSENAEASQKAYDYLMELNPVE